MITTIEYTDVSDALEDLDKASKRLEMVAELFGSNPKDYPSLQSDNSRFGVWLALHDTAKTLQRVIEAISKTLSQDCNGTLTVPREFW